MNALRSLAASLLVIALFSGALPSRAADEASAHRPGLRDQWQPQTEKDTRLARPVRLEILGRAAVPALEILSKEAGVTLQVAPEDVETVGERKVTIIAQGCSLKSILVQIPNALQECHWDVDMSGPQLIYLLHRNAGVEATKAQLPTEEESRRQGWAENRAAREARVALARRALTMSPAELAELEKSDLYLARSVQDPKSRFMLELFLALPEAQMREFIAAGQIAMAYPAAPERFQQAAVQLLQRTREEAASKPPEVAEVYLKLVDLLQGDLAHTTIQYEEDGGDGAYLRMYAFTEEGDRWSWGVEPALWSQFPPIVMDIWYRPLFLNSGTPDEKAADALAQEWDGKGKAERLRQRDEKRAREWQEPRSAALHKLVKLPFEGSVDTAEVQRYIAEQTGLSVISDYFTLEYPNPIPDEARESMPAWRLLYLLDESWFWTHDWDEKGDCLVFHDRLWYRRPPEVPESLVQEYRDKLAQQGRFTLDDYAAAAAAMARRPDLRAARWPSLPVWPHDLSNRGMNVSPRPSLLLYATLSPEQRAALREGKDLPYAAMTPEQRDLVRQAAVESEAPDSPVSKPKRPLSEDEITSAMYRVVPSPSEGEPGAEQAVQIEFQVVFPGRTETSSVTLELPRTQPLPAPPR